MSKIKRLLCMAVVVIMVASLFTACGSSKKDNQAKKEDTAAAAAAPKETAKPAEKKTLVVYSMEVIKDSECPAFFKEFEEKNNATIKPILVNSDKYVQSFMVAANGGQQIDVLILNGQDVRSFAKKGLIAELTNDVKYYDRFNESAVNTFKFNGKNYGVPIQGGPTSGLYYNKDILDKYKIQPPKTYADLVAASKELAKDGISAIGFGGGSIYMWPMWYFDAFAQTSGNKSVDRTVAALEGKAKWTEADFVEAMKALENFGKDGLFQKGFNGADTAAGQAVFTSGKAAFFFGGTWEIDGFTKAGVKNLGIVPFPVIKNGAKSEQCGAGSTGALCLYSKAAAANKDLNLKLMDYCSTDAKAKEISTYRKDIFSPNKNVKLDNSESVVKDIINNKLPETTVPFLDWIWAPEVTKVFQEQIQAVTGGQTTAEKAMAEIQKVFDDIKAKGYDFNATK